MNPLNFHAQTNSFSLEGDTWQTEIGDSKQKDFHPQIKIKKWNNEVNYSVRLLDFNAEYELDGNKIKMGNDDREVHIYEQKFNSYQHHRDINTRHLETVDTVEFSEENFPHLIINGEIWGRDDEVEREIRKEAASCMSGDVLIVGLGLGVINEYLKQNKKVRSITICEISIDVINIVLEHYPERLEGITVIGKDFYDMDGRFDSVYGDIFHRIDVTNLNAWERFVEKAQTLTDGTIDGRIREFYEAHDQSHYDEDTHEIEVILKKKPETNQIKFSIRSKGVEFLYQPELTEEEKKTCIRPVHVVGSYAIYADKEGDYTEVGGHNYQSGKVGHIYRPQIEDAKGNKVWGNLNIEDGIMTVTIPQDFLDAAVYPIRHASGSTFGFTSQGATNEANLNEIYSLPSTSGSDAGGALVTKMSVAYSNSVTVNSKCNIYDSSNVPITNAETNQNTSSSIGFNDYLYGTSPTISASTSYKLCVWTQGAGKTALAIKYDSGQPNGTGGKQALTYGTWPNPLNAVDQNRRYSIYATYTPGAATNSNFLAFI